MSADRHEFLINVYNQMFNDINRHIMVVWQSVGVLVGAFAILALVEKKVVSLDVAVSLIVLISAWLLAHLIDAAYWYNRNLIIISNIERQFLLGSDVKNISYYFAKHRPKNKMITHLKIQIYLGVGLAAIVLLYHFVERVLPGIKACADNFEFLRSLPYMLVVVSFVLIYALKSQRDKSYKEFLDNSPGIEVDSGDAKYGVGHGH